MTAPNILDTAKNTHRYSKQVAEKKKKVGAALQGLRNGPIAWNEKIRCLNTVPPPEGKEDPRLAKKSAPQYVRT